MRFEKPPGLPAEESEYFALRDGFYCKNKAYLLITDAVMFEPEFREVVPIMSVGGGPSIACSEL